MPSSPPMYILDEERYKKITGNASDEIKQHLVYSLYTSMARGQGFADSIGGRLRVSEADIHKKPDEPTKLEARIVCEIDVTLDMLNGGGSLHGGCSAYLVDLCSTMPILALSLSFQKGSPAPVSQVINMVYHSPARIGDNLRIISTSISLGTRSMSARSEIWNATHHRLVASGVHIKMDPSPPKL
ncbi:hypothetical protein EW145_g5407 [Phellinidium pouzarii]|uniref:Thioesterase domain-containing protein n=1 Tax=Phellinidium pouzarii TaxID=167371 RepID=A0A4S4L0A1_9AGAM|nr:hypothetical protein EW145_g5407 [Phellinidium pouzarii]